MGLLLGTMLIFTILVANSFATPVTDPDAELLEYIGTMKDQLLPAYGEIGKALSLEDSPERWVKFDAAMRNLHEVYARIYNKFKSYPYDSLKNEDVKRVYEVWTHYGVEDVTAEERIIFISNPFKLREIGTKKVFCDYSNPEKCDLNYIDDIQHRIAKAGSVDELLYYWKQWRSKIGSKEAKILFDTGSNASQFSKRENETSSDMYYFYYGRQQFWQSLQRIHDEIQPLYKQLFTYIRKKLRAKFGEDAIPKSGLIPQHLMDQVLAQVFTTEFDIDYPYENMLNFTKILLEKEFTGVSLAQTANEFYESVHMFDPITVSLADNSSACTPPKSYEKVDGFWRMKVCPKVDFAALLQNYYNLLNVRYKSEYTNFMMTLDAEATRGFSRALTNAVVLSVLTPEYMSQIELMKPEQATEHHEINRLYRLALGSILALNIHLTHERLLMDIMNGEHNARTINQVYADMLKKYAGIEIPHTEETYDLILPHEFLRGVGHANPNTENIYPEIMGYEFYRGLCSKAEFATSKNLKDCNLYGHREVGKALRKMMSYGAKKDWWLIAEEVTGKDQISSTGLLEYFKPLQSWLEEQNKNELVGW